MRDIENLMRFTGRLRIAHHIPGRIRLKLDASVPKAEVDDIARAKWMKKVFGDTPGIRSVSLNLLARSCTVEYDSQIIPAAAWSDLLRGTRSPAAEVLLNILAARRREPSET